MSVEDALREIIKEELLAHGLIEEEKKGRGRPKGKAKVEEPEDDDDDKPEITLETLKEKLTAYIKEHDKDEAKKVLKKFKVSKLSEVDEDDFEKLDKMLTPEDDSGLFGDDDC